MTVTAVVEKTPKPGTLSLNVKLMEDEELRKIWCLDIGSETARYIQKHLGGELNSIKHQISIAENNIADSLIPQARQYMYYAMIDLDNHEGMGERLNVPTSVAKRVSERMKLKGQDITSYDNLLTFNSTVMPELKNNLDAIKKAREVLDGKVDLESMQVLDRITNRINQTITTWVDLQQKLGMIPTNVEREFTAFMYVFGVEYKLVRNSVCKDDFDKMGVLDNMVINFLKSQDNIVKQGR